MYQVPGPGAWVLLAEHQRIVQSAGCRALVMLSCMSKPVG